ncbi:MAG: sulfotransferase, partial [Acidimicrobiia bacterium]|nr:sulfotransferase [Acidimicrobiia bacterium]
MATRDQIIEMACTDAGLDDFGDDAWSDALDVLLASLRDEARLHEMGDAVATAQVAGSLANRLRVLDWHKHHPAAAEADVPAPIVIVGQPRTGTTILHDLLAQDAGLRAPLTWEVDQPVPPPQTSTYDTDPRIAAAEEAAALTEAVLPGFQAIHPTGPRRAQECVTITAGDVRSLQFGTVFHIPTYTSWLLDEADMASAYRYHRQFLQLLQSSHTGEHWLLKTPAHQWHLADLFATYPDATIVHTHRDPVTVLASTASLTSVLQRLGTDDPSLPELASEWAGYLAEGNRRSVVARVDGTVPTGRAIDVHFGDLMVDPFATIGAIYDQLGRELTTDTEGAMHSFLAAHARDKHGAHTYRFADTGLDEVEVRAANVDY